MACSSVIIAVLTKNAADRADLRCIIRIIRQLALMRIGWVSVLYIVRGIFHFYKKYCGGGTSPPKFAPMLPTRYIGMPNYLL